MWAVQKEILSLVALVVMIGPTAWLWSREAALDEVFRREQRRLFPDAPPYVLSSSELWARRLKLGAVFAVSMVAASFIYPA